MELPKTMKEAHVHADTSVTIHDVPLPKIEHPSQIIIKVAVSGCNPKDWKMPAGILKTIANCPNSGDDIAGTVAAVGDDVIGFRPGDRVASLHQLGASGGSFAEYALVWDFTTFHIGKQTSFEAAATVPMAGFMAAVGIYGMLRLTAGPWEPLAQATPLLVYGAAGAVGSMAVKMAKLVDAHPIICIAGRGIAYVESLLDKAKGDIVIDYRKGSEAVVSAIKDALKGSKLLYAFDSVSEKDSFANVAQVLDPENGRVSFVLPQHRPEFASTVEQSNTMAGILWKKLEALDPSKPVGKLDYELKGREFAFVFSTLIGRFLANGTLQPHPFEVSEGGLAGLESALKKLRSGKASAQKFVVRIGDTPDLN